MSAKSPAQGRVENAFTPLSQTPTISTTMGHPVTSWDEEEDYDTEFGGTVARRELEKKLLWKIDKRMSILLLIYILNIIDRNNAGAARLRGFEEDLGLQGQQFATLLAVLYAGYITMQIPSNMFLNHIGKPSLYLPICMIVWGLVSILTGISTNFAQVLLSRFLLGVVEASFFPGAIFLIGRWYKHNELGMRTAILLCGIIISSAFGALIASAILDTMQGVLGQAAWRWLFYIEGALTIAVATYAIFVLPDFPETTRPGWLTEEEVRLAVRRMKEDADMSDDYGVQLKSLSEGLWMAISDRNVWVLAAAMFFLAIMCAFSGWFPTIMATLGYSRTITLLLCAPPYLLTTVITFLASRHSDATGERFYHVTVPLWACMLGFLIAMCTMNTAARYFSLFLITLAYTGFSLFVGWQSNVIPGPPAKRAVALAFTNSASSLGNIVGSYVWQPSWAPTFSKSLGICVVAGCAAVASCYVVKRRLEAMNIRLHRAEMERGERRTGFRYLV